MARLGVVAGLVVLALGTRPGTALGLSIHTVSNTSDSGGGSLRQAILDANAGPGPDAIWFSIPGPGVHSILPLSALPPVTDTASIAGWTQPGYSGTPLIQLDGSGSLAVGLVFQAGGEVGGLDIVGFTSAGLALRGVGVIVAHNVIGADPSGSVAMPNGVGVFDEGRNTIIGGPGVGNVISGNLADGIVLGGASSGAVVTQNLIGLTPGGLTLGNGANGVLAECAEDALVEDNVISANGWGGSAGFGINILGCGLKNAHQVQGNLIGTNVLGTFAFPNRLGGVHLVDTRDVLIGGQREADGNVISGNAGPGVWVDTGASRTTIEGNLIGPTAIPVPGHEGIPLPNAGAGVLIQDAESTVVGGAKAGLGNVVSGNQGGGIRIQDSESTSVFGNLIGTDVAGELPLGNVGPGVEVDGGRFTFLGGGIPGQGNVISANTGDGVVVLGSDFTGQPARDVAVMANLIGTGLEPGSILGNGANGVTVGPNASGTRIGRILGPSMANVIKHNGGVGVGVVGSTGVQITGNAIADNAGLGIDLGLNGVTPNDGAGDLDTGANDLQNFPVLSNVVLSNGALSVHVHLESSPNTTYSIELFFGPVCDPSGFGEGMFFVASAKAKSLANGTADIDMKVQGVSQIPTVTATAIDTKTLDTSEFSHCV